jgi:uncharacterized membrane protein YidH (DUF202 family)
MSDDPQGQDPAQDDEPDVRFTYANERTFLVWNRTALPLIATGVAATEVAETWDEGLAPQRTQMAWGRTGLAVAATLAVLSRRVWALGGGLEVAALVLVAAGGLMWVFGMRMSRDHLHMDPHGLVGSRAFALVSGGTLLLAAGASVFSVVLPH